MSRLLLILAAVLALGACAPDDQVFNVSALSERHQRIFTEAAADLNERYPDRAQFEIGGGASYVRYGPAHKGGACNEQSLTACTTQIALPSLHWEILVESEHMEQGLITHELCHVLGFGHDEGNPQGGSC